jgi:adenine-specific DNA-methyltransferase
MLTNQTGLFERSKKEQTVWNKSVTALTADIKTVELEIEEIIGNKIYENAFEWRFEFPDVLNDNGDFVGFDVVIGNPPYVDMRDISAPSIIKYKNTYITASNRINLFTLFIELSFSISIKKGFCSMIIPRNIIRSNEYSLTRELILNKSNIDYLLSFKIGVFEDVTSEVIILILNKNKSDNNEIRVFNYDKIIDEKIQSKFIPQTIFENSLGKRFNIYLNTNKVKILKKISDDSLLLGKITETLQGIIAGDEKN